MCGIQHVPRKEVKTVGLFDKPAKADGSIKELAERGSFYLVGVGIRENVQTMYGPADAIDLTVHDPDGQERVYSGFSAGLLHQVRNAADGDLPAWVAIEKVDIGGGKHTLNFVPAEAGTLFDPDEGDIPF
jgi:hypothetical protein